VKTIDQREAVIQEERRRDENLDAVELELKRIKQKTATETRGSGVDQARSLNDLFRKYNI
jgi:hypothetical protein